MYIWSWGANSHGQLAQSIVSEQVEQPAAVSRSGGSWGNVVQIACGGGHSLLIDNEGKIFSCGWNHKLQLGTKGGDTCVFERLWNLSGIKFTMVACGWDFSCAVTDDQFLFVWGSNSHGQLGLPRDHFSENVKPVRLHVKARAVSMGLRHTVVVSAAGDVWSTGAGRHGQLGHGPAVVQLDRLEKVADVRAVSQVACGQRHTVAWSAAEGALYVWGDNRHGQLLLDARKYPQVFTPQKIDIDLKCPVRRLLGGWSGAALWLDDGALLAWGRADYGQLASGTRDCRMLTHISLPEGRVIEDIAVGSEHWVCAATDGSVWAWGWNEHGNTGTGREPCVPRPAPVHLPLARPVAAAACYAGAGHNFLLTPCPHEPDLPAEISD